MRNKLIIFIVVIVIIVLLFIFVRGRRNKVIISSIKSFSFSYSVGYAMNSYVRYNMELIDNKYKVIIKPNGIPDDDALEVEVDKRVMLDVEEVLKKYKVNLWDGFQKSDKNVLDGDSFSLSVSMIDGGSISAHGYMKWPNNYGNVKGEIDSIFMNIYNKNK